jgi:hypothetical protein
VLRTANVLRPDGKERSKVDQWCAHLRLLAPALAPCSLDPGVTTVTNLDASVENLVNAVILDVQDFVVHLLPLNIHDIDVTDASLKYRDPAKLFPSSVPKLLVLPKPSSF